MTILSVIALSLSSGIVMTAFVGKVFTAVTFRHRTFAVLAAAEGLAIAAALATPNHQMRSLLLGLLFAGFTVYYSSLLLRRRPCECFGGAKPTSAIGLVWRSAIVVLLFAVSRLAVGNGVSRMSLIAGTILGAALGLWRLRQPVSVPTQHSSAPGDASDESHVDLLPRRSVLKVLIAGTTAVLAGGVLRPSLAAALGLHPTECLMWLNRCSACCEVGCYGIGCYNSCNGCYSYCLNFATNRWFCTDIHCWNTTRY